MNFVPRKHSLTKTLVVSLIAFAVASLVTFSLWDSTFHKVPFALFFAAVAIAAWLGGWASGLLVGLAGVMVVNFRFGLAAGLVGPSLILLGVSAILSLISASRDRFGQSLDVAEARNAAILDAALDAVVTIDSRGTVLEWNPAAVAILGYTREEALGKEMAELFIPPKFRDAHRAGMKKYLATGEGPVLGKRLELSAVRKDGVEIPVELAITRVPIAGEPMFTGHMRDISARRQAEAEKQALLESERAARTEVERASQMKDEFLATLSHELRTPLTAILGWAQVLRNTSEFTEEAIVEGLSVIERNARSQTQIIEDLLDMSRIISGKIRLDVHQIELADAVKAAIETVRPAAETRNIRIQAVLDPLAHPMSGDPNRLQQVFWNLLSNAVKFTPKGGRVQVRLERINSHVEVSITDTGEGIAPEFLPYVFDRFRQADATTTRQHGGLGLGLSIVKQLVELHGGSVSVKSAGSGSGSTFTVALPLTIVHPELDPETERRHPEMSTNGVPLDGCAKIDGLKILVVDDETDARSLMKRVLSDCAAVVTAVPSAADAMEQLQADRFDILVSDIGMPTEDGYSLIKRIRKLPADRGGAIPAIALTAYARSEDRVKSILAGFQIHLSKPVEPAELIAMVASLAGKNAAQ